VEVCAVDFAGGGRDVVSAFAFQARGGGRMKRHENTFRERWQIHARKAIALVVLCLGCSAGAGSWLKAVANCKFCLRTEPKTFDPLKVEDDASDAIRYLTGGVLVRVNRQTQELEPGLAVSWKVSKGRKADFVPPAQRNFIFRWHTFFRGRRGLHRAAIDGPGTAFADRRRFSFGYGQRRNQGDFLGLRLSIHVPRLRSPGLDRLFDQVAILSERSPKKEMAVLGPFMVAELQTRLGGSILLKRNPNYWKTDEQGTETALSGFDPAGYSAQPRCGNCCASSAES
jgi:hypothetical protein